MKTGLTPAMAREMDRCGKVPHALDAERAWGIVKIHEEHGTCTTETCYRLAAARGFIEDQGRPIGIHTTDDGAINVLDADGWTDRPQYRDDQGVLEDGRTITVAALEVIDHPQQAIE